MTPQTTRLEHLLGQVFDGCRNGLRNEVGPAEYERRRRDFIFHMMDWRNDLEPLARLYERPEGQDADAASTFLIGFLYHIIPHLAAAGRLLLDEVPDPFADAVPDRKPPYRPG
jgi:hypothetical protein